MIDSSNSQEAPREGTPGRVCVPKNWYECAVADGMDPAERAMQIKAFGWEVSNEIRILPPQAVRVVNATTPIMLGELSITLGIIVTLVQARCKHA